jgi:hypothetical protein
VAADLRVLFFMRNLRGYFRVFEPALRQLGADGMRVHVVCDDKPSRAEEEWVTALQRECPGVTFGAVPDRRGSRWDGLARSLRIAADYLRFLRPEFAATPDLQQRAGARAPRMIVWLMHLPGLRRPRTLAFVTRLVTRLEAAIPSSPVVEAFIRAFDPHVVLISPLLSMGSRQPDYLKSARSLGIPTMLAVASWDNLSSKSMIRSVPDLITVWNDTQRREAIDLHGIPAERIAVTGAQNFDPWFEWAPTARSRFLARVGLPPDRPFILYTCSSLFDAPISEAQFVGEWVRALRSSPDAAVRDVAVLIRPHPKRSHEWDTAALAGVDGVVLWPRTGTMPVDAEAKADYFDSLYHSAAVVGLNTSAMLEAGIVGRTVHTVLSREFAGSQGGTLHFHYLTDVEGGLLRVAATLDEHVQQLAEALAGVTWGAEQRRRFLQAFIRPFGLDVPASPRFSAAVTTLAGQQRPQPVVPSIVDRLWYALLTPFAIRSQLAYKGTKAIRRLQKRAAARGVRAGANEYGKLKRGRNRS